ncbi:peptide deformylase [Endobacter medicaginis]|uniref:Peptide deformylase n=1 Tax=Endobacter medicaginis TaxID=1181271 RepID=A0A850NSK2_9PROT|nr:peptide deformylase [Endobacter medicaginis]MBB3172802.1 peptide deformylase [Endobacter medicaginis]MCX5474409.1 peptide deformylase [Endobacter medicaginis]NVN30315.1 peptide deformylase [Endobacter medicaginis]
MSETEPTDAELLEILIAPHPTLRARARSVAPGELDAIRALLPAMYATMYKAPGIGLAAPQIGQSRRFAIVDVADGDERRPITLINPEIVARSESLAVHEEGCLSIPDIYAEITRPEHVTVRYLDEQGAAQTLSADGLLGVCLQHEIDHLDGVLFVDHLSALKRNMLMRKLAKNLKGR